MSNCKVRFPPTREELERHQKMSHEEKQLRCRIAYEKAHFNSVETVARHRMELGVWSSKEYRKTVSDAEDRMEKTTKRLQQEFDERYGE